MATHTDTTGILASIVLQKNPKYPEAAEQLDVMNRVDLVSCSSSGKIMETIGVSPLVTIKMRTFQGACVLL